MPIIPYKTLYLDWSGTSLKPMLAVAKANAPACFTLRGRVCRPMRHAVIAWESLRFGRSDFSSEKTQNWNYLIIRPFALLRMTEPESKRAFLTKNAPFSFIFHPVLVHPSRRLEHRFMTKCLRFVIIPSRWGHTQSVLFHEVNLMLLTLSKGARLEFSTTNPKMYTRFIWTIRIKDVLLHCGYKKTG